MEAPPEALLSFLESLARVNVQRLRPARLRFYLRKFSDYDAQESDTVELCRTIARSLIERATELSSKPDYGSLLLSLRFYDQMLGLFKIFSIRFIMLRLKMDYLKKEQKAIVTELGRKKKKKGRDQKGTLPSLSRQDLPDELESLLRENFGSESSDDSDTRPREIFDTEAPEDSFFDRIRTVPADPTIHDDPAAVTMVEDLGEKEDEVVDIFQPLLDDGLGGEIDHAGMGFPDELSGIEGPELPSDDHRVGLRPGGDVDLPGLRLPESGPNIFPDEAGRASVPTSIHSMQDLSLEDTSRMGERTEGDDSVLVAPAPQEDSIGEALPDPVSGPSAPLIPEPLPFVLEPLEDPGPQQPRRRRRRLSRLHPAPAFRDAETEIPEADFRRNIDHPTRIGELIDFQRARMLQLTIRNLTDYQSAQNLLGSHREPGCRGEALSAFINTVLKMPNRIRREQPGVAGVAGSHLLSSPRGHLSPMLLEVPTHDDRSTLGAVRDAASSMSAMNITAVMGTTGISSASVNQPTIEITSPSGDPMDADNDGSFLAALRDGDPFLGPASEGTTLMVPSPVSHLGDADMPHQDQSLMDPSVGDFMGEGEQEPSGMEWIGEPPRGSPVSAADSTHHEGLVETECYEDRVSRCYQKLQNCIRNQGRKHIQSGKSVRYICFSEVADLGVCSPGDLRSVFECLLVLMFMQKIHMHQDPQSPKPHRFNDIEFDVDQRSPNQIFIFLIRDIIIQPTTTQLSEGFQPLST